MKLSFRKIGFGTVFFIFLIILSEFYWTGCSEKIALVENGRSDYKILLSEQAIPSEKYAASELQKYIRQICGYRLQITTDYQQSEKYVFIGFLKEVAQQIQDVDAENFGSEEYMIKTFAGGILIAGGKPRGTLYGVTAFLSDYLGCRWYTPDFMKIPQSSDIILPLINIRDKPVFEYREAWYREAYDAEWAVHNRLNPSIKSPPDSMGGGYKIYPFVHTFYNLVSPKKYFKTHPEYFSMIDGKRKDHEAQLCLTNPQVVKIALQTVYQWIEEHPDVQVLSIDQNDGYGFCECANCKAIDEAEGSHSGTILTFVNQIADAVAKSHPGIRLQTLAYVYSEIPPKTIKPHPIVTIRLCHYNYCSAHHLEGCNSHKVYIERLVAWSKIADRLTIWDYFTDFSRYLLPFPNFESLKHDVRFYADHNCIGLFAQGCNVPEKGGGEFASLRAWVFAQLMWNPYQDGQALIDEFVTQVYAEAAPFIKAYIDLLHEKVRPDSVFFSIYADPTDGGYLTPDLVQESVRLFEKAEKSASSDPALLKRVELAGLPVLYTQLYFYSTGGKGYLHADQMPAVLSKFERILRENNITQIAESPDRGNISKFIDKVKQHYTYLTDWWIIGPFDNPNGKGLQVPYPPELEFESDKTYTGRNNQTVRWRQVDNQQSGYIDFTKLFRESDLGVAYAHHVLEYTEDHKVKIGIGSNDGVRLWINGKIVLDNQTARKAEPNQDILDVNLKKGKNEILLKIDQTGGGWGFFFTIIDN